MHRNLLAFLFLLLSFTGLASAQTATVSLVARADNGSVVPNGTLTFTLMNCGAVVSNPVAVLMANAGGVVSGSVPQSNSTAFACTGSGSYYSVTLTSTAGQLLWRRPYQVTSSTSSLASPLAAIPAAAATGSAFVRTGTLALPTTSITNGTCTTATTTTGATGVLATDTVAMSSSGSIHAVTGYGSGGVSVYPPYSGSGSVNVDVCNWTASPITPGAVTMNWRVSR